MSWKIEKLGSVCDIRTGKKDVNEGNADGAYPFFTCAEKHTYSDVYSFDCEAILIAGNGAVGQTSYYKGKFEAYQRTYVLCNFVNIIPQYLLYVLDGSLLKVLSTQVLGNTIPYIKKGMLAEFQIPLPPIATQEKIVSKLNTIFAGLEKTIAATLTNTDNTEALFESYLTKVFQLNCKNFKKYSIGDICKIIGGGTPSKANLDFYKGNIPWATVRDMNVDIINETDCKISEKAVELSSTNIIPKNSLVIATRVGLGKVCILGQDTAINQDLKGIIPIDNLMLETLYLFYWFKSVARKIIAAGRGATVNGVTLPFIRSLEIMLPELANQKIVIQNTCDLQSNLDRLKILNQKKINELLLLKQSILKHAFSGELIKE